MNYKEPEKEFAISGVIDRLEGELVVVILKNNQILKWPKDKFSEEVKEGDVVWVHLSCDKDLTKEREKIARKIHKTRVKKNLQNPEKNNESSCK